ncbi:MAG TPA: glycine cleavage T C-terminal barrel domain-containing protein [Solirubrobacteraceae bacterium]|jgi:folate-binding protein YgfZ|nr:glycine cleavage T C-terminal barrel domain-containing protein [Solirubrobacteraceae bacterium]
MRTNTLAAPPDPLEHRALLEGAGLFDRSDRGKLAVTGDEADRFLDSMLSNDIAGIPVGGGAYATLLTHKGRILADPRVIRTDEGFLLDTERVGLQALFDAIRQLRIGYLAELHKRTLERSLVSLIGPRSETLVTDPPAAGEHANTPTMIAGIPVLAVRTPVGIDLIFEAQELGAVRGELERLGAIPVGEAAVECLRVERGAPRLGIDMDETTMPQEAGIHGRAVSFTKGCYVGQETVARLYWKGKPNRHLRGLELSGPASPGDELRLGETVVGSLTSVALSPIHGPIALALVRRAAGPGDRLTVADGSVTATVTNLPFAGGGDAPATER